MSMLESFKFKSKDTPIHNLDPRTKMALTTVLSVITMMYLNIIPLLIILLFEIPILILAKSISEWLKTMKGVAVLILFVFVINAFLASAIHPVSFALAMSIRLITLMTSFSLFFLTVHPDDLAQALIQMKVPFEFAFALSMATRYVPTLAMETQTIIDAQRSRGVELDKGSITTRIKNTIPILIPLLVVSIRRAISVAESLESRAFGSSKSRTYLFKLKMRKRDYAIIIISFSIMVFIIWVQMTSGLPTWMMWEIPF